MFNIKNGRFAKESIIYFAEFPICKKGKKTGKMGTLIFTKARILFCSDSPSIIYKSESKAIRSIEVYEGEKDKDSTEKKYRIYFLTKNNKNYVCETEKYSLAQRTYNIIQREIVSQTAK